MRVLMVSKACLVGSYQTKLEAIAAHEDVDHLTVVVPPLWADPAGPVQLERTHTAGYRLVVDPIRFNGRYHLFYFPTLKRRLAEAQPDVVHIDEEPYNLATWLAMRQARRAGAKSLFFSWQNINRRYPPPFRWLEAQVLAGVAAAIVGNQDAAAVWRAKGYRGLLRVIPQFGVDPTIFQPAQGGVAARPFTIGVANRRLVAEKGVDLLLRAAASLAGEWRLLVAGKGPERPLLTALARQLDIARRVQFVGAIGSERMPAFLQGLDVLVLPSRTRPHWKEQFGRVLIEAMACGVPVIGSDSGEIPHVIGDAGLVFPEDDQAALIEHLKLLQQSAARRRALGEKGRQRVLAQYTQVQIAAQTVALYDDMMAE